MTGLHCGEVILSAPTEDRDVFPVFMTGLHCGKEALAGRVNALNVFPVFMTGLHCGYGFVESWNPTLTSSRSS